MRCFRADRCFFKCSKKTINNTSGATGLTQCFSTTTNENNNYGIRFICFIVDLSNRNGNQSERIGKTYAIRRRLLHSERSDETLLVFFVFFIPSVNDSCTGNFAIFTKKKKNDKKQRSGSRRKSSGKR